jgi:hypothetical protein
MPPGIAVKELLAVMRNSAAAKGEKTDYYDLPDPGAGDVRVIKRLNEALAEDPNADMPEGYKKVADKEIEIVYEVPEVLPISENQRMVLELLDEVMAKRLGFHMLEP